MEWVDEHLRAQVKEESLYLSPPHEGGIKNALRAGPTTTPWVHTGPNRALHRTPPHCPLPTPPIHSIARNAPPTHTTSFPPRMALKPIQIKYTYRKDFLSVGCSLSTSRKLSPLSPLPLSISL